MRLRRGFARRFALGLGLVALGLVAVGVTVVAASSVARAADPPGIVEGEPATMDPAVVAIVTRAGGAACPGAPELVCSGTLIAPRVVLTAAHCVNQPVEIVEVFFGDDLNGEGRSLRAAALRADLEFDPVDYAHDIGAIILGEDAPVAPVPINTVALSAATIGGDARIVGFGVPEAGGGAAGLKRTGQTLVFAVAAGSFDTIPNPAMSCQLDSGGPVLLRDGEDLEVLAGVTSNGDALCQAYGTNTRVDAHLDDFVLAVLDEAAGGGLTVPPAPDPAACLGCTLLGCGEGEVCELETDSCVVAEDEGDRGCAIADHTRGATPLLLSLLSLLGLGCATRRRRPGSRPPLRQFPSKPTMRQVIADERRSPWWLFFSHGDQSLRRATRDS